jgi:hypothetical protein
MVGVGSPIRNPEDAAGDAVPGRQASGETNRHRPVIGPVSKGCPNGLALSPTAAAPVSRRKCGEEGCQGHQQRYCAVAPHGFECDLDVNGAGISHVWPQALHL